jgi:hypothetical protein
MSFENAESVALELKQFTENDGDIYRQTTTPILKNLITKRAQGKYDHELAAQAFMYLAEAGARKYAREFDRNESRWHAMFPIEVRRQIAAEWRDEFEQEAELGNYDNLLPKKYQHLTAKKPKVPKEPRSASYLSGKRDGESWVRSADPTRATLSALMRNEPGILMPHEELLREKSSQTVAKKLGIPLTAVKKKTKMFEVACEQYSAGYYDTCQRILDAMKGN